MNQNTLIIGLDECGTGELAGPMAVCAFHSNVKASRGLYAFGAKDSKTTSMAYRRDFQAVAATMRSGGNATYAVTLAFPGEIEAEGIVSCWSRLAREAVTCVVETLNPSWTTTIKLHVDGQDPVPGLDEQIEQVLGARLDVTDVRVSSASILAKEALDRYWLALHETHPEWDFSQHRGAASPHHIRMLQEHGPLPGIHRSRPLETLMKTIAKGGGPIGLDIKR